MGRTMQAALKSVRFIGDTPRVVASPDDFHDEIHESELSEDSEQSSDEGSDYGNSKNKGKAPPAKRAKTSSSAAHAKQSSAKSSRQRKSLSLLPAMPLDVLFEVFSHLSPKDIIHLSRTSRVFRDTLMMKNASSVWKTAREQFGAPECPPNLSEPQWAVLLFGNLCQSCGAKNILRPEFALLRRACISCKKQNILVESKFKTRFTDVDPEVLELIPFTNVGAWSHGFGRSGRSRFFWIPDINAMLRKLAKYQHDVHLRRPGAHQALDDFKTQQIKLVASIHELRPEREMWSEQFALGRYQDKQTIINQRFESIQSKFLELGYVASDVTYVRSQRECQQPALLTDRIWKRIRPILEPTVLQYKRERLEREMKGIRAARRLIIHACYQEYKKMLLPSQWKYLPRTVDICAMDPFAVVLDAEGDVTVTAAHFEDAFRQLPELLLADTDSRRLHARSLLKIATSVNQALSTSPEPGEIVEGEASSSSNSSQPDAMDLATAVFACREVVCNRSNRKQIYLFGWHDIAQHHCKSDLDSLGGSNPWSHARVEREGPSDILFRARGSEIAATIVRAVGLDDRVATVSDMDAKAKDIRFGCSVCPSKRAGTSWAKTAYKWRNFVSHCALQSHLPKDALVILPPEVTAKVKESEMTDPDLSKSLWTCGHCAVHLGDLKLRGVVIEHLKSAHGIDSPREPEDLFLFARGPSLDAFEVGYPVEAPASHASQKTVHCLQCAEGKPSERERLFDVNGVKSHLGAKHKVTNPVIGTHYR